MPKERALGEVAVADLAAAGGAEAADLARAVGREVVVEEELLLRLAAGDRVDLLRVLERGERADAERLRLAAAEHGRAVGAREDADLGGERADVVEPAAVDALAALEDVLADGLDLEAVLHRAELLVGHLGELRGEVRLHRGGRLLDGVLAGELAGDREDLGELLAEAGARGVQQVLAARVAVDDVLLGLAELGAELLLDRDDLRDALLAELERGEEVRLRDLLGAALHHEEAVRGAGVEQVEVALAALGLRGVEDELAVHAADAHGADRAHERDLGDVERGRGGDHGEEVRLVDAVGAQQRVVHLHVVVVAVGEERADRAVREAGGEDLLLGGARLALEEAAGEAAAGVELLAVLALQREVVDALAGRLGAGDGGEDDVVAEGGGDGSGGLLGEEAGLDDEGLAPDVAGNGNGVFHGVSLFLVVRCVQKGRPAGLPPAVKNAALRSEGSPIGRRAAFRRAAKRVGGKGAYRRRPSSFTRAR